MLYPLRFKPLYRQYIWGGRRFQTVLERELGSGAHYAESWEAVDHGEDQSVVAHGPLAGRSLHQLVVDNCRELFGQHTPQGQFPLLFKLLDAQHDLSVQVHPNDDQAGQLDPPDLGKTEAWVVLGTEPGGCIYAGLKRGFDRAALAREVARGTTELCLNRFEPSEGNCVFIPAGVVHALGKGLLVAEIQQASDTTYRLFDWNRVGTDGQPRQLHVEQALETIDYDAGPVGPQQPTLTEDPHVERIVACNKFVLDRWQFDAERTVGGDDRFHLLAVLSGTVEVSGDYAEVPLGKASTILIPASLGPVTVRPREKTTLLDMYLPSAKSRWIESV